MRDISFGDSKPSITLSGDTRIFRHWADPAPTCIYGVTVATYANQHGAVLLVGSNVARYNNSKKLRELAAGLIATAEALEARK